MKKPTLKSDFLGMSIHPRIADNGVRVDVWFDTTQDYEDSGIVFDSFLEDEENGTGGWARVFVPDLEWRDRIVALEAQIELERAGEMLFYQRNPRER